MEKRHLAVVTLRDTTPEIELWAAGNDKLASFAVCGHGGRPLWYSTYGADHAMHPAWKTAPAQTVAAAKAIWLAGRARAGLHASRVRLRLHLSDPDIDAAALTEIADKAGVAYNTDVVWGSPALDWCNEPGRAEWREADLSNLVSHRDRHAPFYHGRMTATVAAAAAAVFVGVVLVVNHNSGRPTTSTPAAVPTVAKAALAGLPAPLRRAASCTQQSASAGFEESCVVDGDDAVVRGLLPAGSSRESFAAVIEPDPARIADEWRQKGGDRIDTSGSTVIRYDTRGSGTVGVETLDTKSGLDVQLSGFRNQQDAREFVRRAGW